MSLNKAEWEEMWLEIKRIENITTTTTTVVTSHAGKANLKTAIKGIKDKIQLAIGKME